jgi:hypothetical protein
LSLSDRGTFDALLEAAWAGTSPARAGELISLAADKAKWGDAVPPVVSIPVSEPLEALNEQIGRLPANERRLFEALFSRLRE